MKKLLKKIKNKEDYDRLCSILSQRISLNLPISDNAMIDGMVIGFILTTKFSQDMFLKKHMGNVLDGTMQKLENIIVWCENNEDSLINLLKKQI